MNVRKTFCFSVFSLILTAVFVSSAFCWYEQRIRIPYVSFNSSTGYWTGVAIHNESTFSGYFDLMIYDSTGVRVALAKCNHVAGGGISAKLLEGWFGTLAEGRYSLVIQTHSGGSHKFSATLFMGNSGTRNPGFAFTSYRSETSDEDTTLVTLCKGQ